MYKGLLNICRNGIIKRLLKLLSALARWTEPMFDIVAEEFFEELEEIRESTDAKPLISQQKLRKLKHRLLNQCSRDLSISALKGQMHNILKTRVRKLPETSFGKKGSKKRERERDPSEDSYSSYLVKTFTNIFFS